MDQDAANKIDYRSERGRRLETLVQLHNYFRSINNHSDTVTKIVEAVETKVLSILEEDK